MNEFFTKISGQIAGPMILGTFFPVVLFVTLFGLLVLPITPYGHQVTELVKDLRLWQEKGLAVVVLTFAILVLTVVLYQLNTPVIRLYEGYPWQESWLGRSLKRCQEKHFERAKLSRKQISVLRREVRMEHISMNLSSITEAQRKHARAMNDEYPTTANLVLPTRLGNVIRAFETYPLRQYGASAIALWPRLLAILDSTYAQALDSARIGVDFMLNTSLLSAVLAVTLLTAGLYWRHPRYYGWMQPWEIEVVVFGVLFYLAYEGAVNRAAEWGQAVKAAFDIYRLPLLTKLGYEVKPSDLADERKMWEIIYYKLSFPDDRTYPDLPYRDPEIALSVDPVATIVTFTRNTFILDDNILEVRVVISNVDPAGFDAAAIVLRNQLPPNQVYLSGSATVDGSPAAVIALNPLQIQIGPLLNYRTCTAVYKIKIQVPK